MSHTVESRQRFNNRCLAVIGAGLFVILNLIFWGQKFPGTHEDHLDKTVGGVFLGLRLNEMDDTFAGLFGLLAFLAAAIAVFLQSRELFAQRKELELSREVMIQQQKAAEEMASAMQDQADIFRQEQLERRQDRFKRLLDQKLRGLRLDIDRIHFRDTWGTPLEILFKTSGEGTPEISPDGQLSLIWISESEKNLPHDELFGRLYLRLFEATSNLQERIRANQVPWFPRSSFYKDILRQIAGILKLRDHLSNDQKVFLDNTSLVGLQKQLGAMIDAQVWGDNGGRKLS